MRILINFIFLRCSFLSAEEPSQVHPLNQDHSLLIKLHNRTTTTFTISLITYFKDKLISDLSIVNAAEWLTSLLYMFSFQYV